MVAVATAVRTAEALRPNSFERTSSVTSPVAVPGQDGKQAVIKRWIMGALGLSFVGIGLAGVFLPGVPTTGPLMAASFFLAKSNPALERRLLGMRIFRKYAKYLDGSTPLPRRARLTALGWMWGSIAASCAWLSYGAKTSSMLLLGIVALGMIGTAVILMIRRERKPAPAA